MGDRYQSLTATRPGGFLAKRLGLPRPEPLVRHRPGQPAVTGRVVLGAAPGGRVAEPLRALLRTVGAEVERVAPADAAPVDAAPRGGAGPGAGAGSRNARPAGTPGAGADRTADAPYALVFDATGITDSGRLRALHAFFHPRIRSLTPCGRVVVLGTPPELAGGPGAVAAQRALEGFVRSLGKEARRGATVQLLLVEPGAEGALESTVRFLLSPRSAYVSGQALRVAAGASAAGPVDWARPLHGRTAVVTGASRGIGAVVAEILARDGARVVCLDLPAQQAELSRVAERIGGTALALDVAGEDAGRRLADRLRESDGGVDVVVHNAGITRDRTLGRMTSAEWDAVLAVNLTAVERLTEGLLAGAEPALRPGGRVVCTSSISGIAGNPGQCNYAASKAGLIGLVQALAPTVADRGTTVNAVAPGFIETRMTAAMPLFVREAGRRTNSLRQAGQPVDVAEAVAFLASPGSAAITGQVLRVCGQALLGA